MGLFSDIFGFLFGWLAPEPPESQSQIGTLLSKEITNQSIEKIYGTVLKHESTKIIFKRTNDADNDDVKNDLLHIIIVWGEAVVSIDNVYIDDINVNDARFNKGGKWVNVINFPNGMESVTAAVLAQAGWKPLADAGWDENDNLSGKACTYIRLEYHPDSDALRNEPRKYSADITGTISQNPIWQLKDYLQAVTYGKGASATIMDTTAFNHAETECDLLIETFTGSGEYRPQFTSNIALDTSRTVLENINVLLKACRCWLPILDGKLTPIIEGPKSPVSYSLSENKEIISLGSVKDSSKSNRFNRVVVKFIDKSANSTVQEAVYPAKDSVVESQWLSQDNDEVLEKTVELYTCDNYSEAQHFAKVYARVSRQQLRVPISGTVASSVLEVGDVVPVSHSFLGWNSKQFWIERTEITEDGEPTLICREYEESVYDLDGGPQPAIPDTDLDTSGPGAPTGLAVDDVYDEVNQVLLRWTSDASRFDIQIFDSSDKQVRSAQRGTKEYAITGLELGDYTAFVRARGGLGTTSVWSSVAFTVSNFANSGIAGQSVYQATIYRRAGSQPATPTGGEYDFTNNALTPPAGWSSDIPVGTAQLWGSTGTFVTDGPTGTATTIWGTPGKVAADGVNGSNGKSTFYYVVFKRSATVPTVPTGGSFNFGSNVRTPPTSWFIDIPSGDDPVYYSAALASVTGDTGIDSTLSWSTPTLYVKNGDKGVDGLLPAPDGDPGLFYDDNHLGYHDGTNWQAYFDSNGRLYLNGNNASQYLFFDGSVLNLTGKGQFSGGVSADFSNAFLEVGLNRSNEAINSAEMGYSAAGKTTSFQADATGARIASTDKITISCDDIDFTSTGSGLIRFRRSIHFDGILYGTGGTGLVTIGSPGLYSNGPIQEEGHHVFSGNHLPSWNEVTGKPAFATRWPSFAEVTGTSQVALKNVDNTFNGLVFVQRSSTGGAAAGVFNQLSTGYVISCRVNGSTVGYVDNSGAYVDSSSIRHKNIIHRDHDVLDKVCQLADGGMVIYESKQSLGMYRIGFIAEEVEPLFPEAVRYDEDGVVDAVHYSGFVAPLAVSIKQLLARIEALENS